MVNDFPICWLGVKGRLNTT